MELIEKKEYHNNGQLKYKETIKKIQDKNAHLFQSKRAHPDGYYWVRVGEQTKHFSNGQLAWKLLYNQFGDIIKTNTPQYRRDGSIIQY